MIIYQPYGMYLDAPPDQTRARTWRCQDAPARGGARYDPGQGVCGDLGRRHLPRGRGDQGVVLSSFQKQGKPMEYVNTGVWSKKAIKEGKFYGDTSIVASSEDENFSYIPKNIEFGNNISFAHITGNNTIYGTEYHNWPKTDDNVPLVCDMSSNTMDKLIDFKKFGVIYAGAQKNIGPAGVTLVIVREDLIERVPENIPTMLKWKTHAKKDSLFNTAPCWAIYMCKLSLEYLIF